MDSYVIRIYRRDGEHPGKAAGQVEVIGQEYIASFTCVEELLNILELQEQEAPGNSRRSKRKSALQRSRKKARKNV